VEAKHEGRLSRKLEQFARFDLAILDELGYPHYVVANLQRVYGKPLGEGFGQATYRDAAATQLSRRSNHRDTAVDTAAAKLWKVLEWLQTR
jgi:hypothetical protein